MDLNALNQSVLRLINNGTKIISFLKDFTVGSAKDVSITYINADGSTSVKTFPNIAKMVAIINGTKDEIPFVNLLKNPHMQTKDSDGNYINLPFSFYDVDISSFRIVDSSTDDIPQEVKDYIAGGLIRGRGNVLELKMKKQVGVNLWIGGNSVSGMFSSGWKWVFVESGRLRDISAGETGSFFETSKRNWNIDSPLGSFEENSVIYLAHPFVVAGKITDTNQVKTLNYNPGVFRFGGEI